RARRLPLSRERGRDDRRRSGDGHRRGRAHGHRLGADRGRRADAERPGPGARRQATMSSRMKLMKLKPPKLTKTFGAPIEGIVSILQSSRGQLGPASRRIVDFIIAHKEDVMQMSITELAEQVSVSESAVTKVCKQIGATGFQQIKLSLAQDIVQPVQ